MAWHGKLLRVNLTKGTCTPEALNMDWVKLYLGQRGLGTKYLYEEIDPQGALSSFIASGQGSD